MTSRTNVGFPKEVRSKVTLVDHVKRGLLAADAERYDEVRSLVVVQRGGMLTLELGSRKMDVTCDSPLALLADIHKLMS